jgi:PAS domain S-box-containing protein
MTTLGRPGKSAFLAVALLLIAMTNGLAYWAVLGLRDSNKWVDRTQEVQAAINEILSEIADAEASVRAFVMTGEEPNLQGLNKAIPSLPSRVMALRSLTANNADQQKRLNALEPLIGDKLAVMMSMAQSYRDAGIGPQSTGVWLRRGISLTKQIRTIAAAMTAEENQLYLLRQQAEATSASRLLLIQLAIGALSFTLVGTLFYMLFAESRRLQNVNAEIETRVRERTEQLDLGVMELREEVSARRKAEDDLRSTRAFLDLVIENIPAMVVVKDARDGRFILVNRTCEQVLGIARAELLGKSDHDLFPKRQADIFKTRDDEVVRSGKLLFTAEEAIDTRRSGTRLLQTMKLPVSGEDGRPKYILVLAEDITQRKSTEEQLRQAQKMEAIGNLTGGMAHDFNNLLSIMIGNLDMLRGQLKGGAPAMPDADQFSNAALEAALRGADLTQRLLAFARRQPLLPVRIDVNELVTRIGKLMGRTLGEDIEIKLDLGAEVWPVIADPAQLDASLVNIFNNARDAMPGGGVVTISTYSRYLDEDYTSAHSELVPGHYAAIEVSDTGTGIAPEALTHIFEPFFTTKEQGKGSGLGLSMVFGFIKQSGGHINVYSEAGHGTTFRLYLPRATAAMDAAATQPTPAPERGGRETILAVEDNADLRRVVVRQLTDLGYRVLEADHAAAAVKALESQPVDLLFTDIVMPGGVNGYDLARSAASRWPEMKVLLTSGFPEAKLNGNGGPPLNMRLLMKPYRKEELARILRELLDAD